MIIKDNQLLLGKRKGSHGAGEYGAPGGHLEAGETFEECALRELKEEAGDSIKVKNIRFLCVTNLQKYAPKYYVDIGMVADWEAGEPIVCEPDKLEGWGWYNLDNLPAHLFGCTNNYLESMQTGRFYFSKT